ncbi:MAG TPA: Gfo/Idh/MocA family oxidoreductase [Acidimicrobiales bacterium]|nr:Gfo/Idh/MocA family oxidoreductase [Acidimicrobiales bacterium]
MSEPLRLALIGAGPAAVNYVRVVNGSRRAVLDVIVDDDLERAEILAEKAGCVMATDIGAAEGCQGAIITTPPDTHAAAALQLIGAGIPVMVEAPLATDLEDARSVVDAAAAQSVPLTCGFIERFNPVVRTAHLLLDEQPLHVLAVRHTPVNLRQRSSVIHDLLIHDIDLAMQFGGGPLVDLVNGCTMTPIESPYPEIADATIKFPNGMIATLSASRVSHREVRSFSIATTNKLIELDLLRHHISVTRHVRHEHLLEGTPTYRAETIVDSPFVRPTGEPLAMQLDQFLDLVEGKVDMNAIRNGLLPPHTIAYRVEQSSPA